MKKAKKILIAIAIAAGVLVLLAVLIGVINGLSGNEWSFGWSDYRYDDTGYQTGSGTVYAADITTIDVSWIDGSVEIVPCGDGYLSLTEHSGSELSEDGSVHWRVSEDGKTLTVKYRASSWYWGMTENRNKHLILRVPEKLFGTLSKIGVEGISTQISVTGIECDAIKLTSTSGNLTTKDCIANTSELSTVSGSISFGGEIKQEIKLASVSGNIALKFPEEASFITQFETVSGGDARIAFPHKREGEHYICGTGENKFTVRAKTTSGELKIEY